MSANQCQTVIVLHAAVVSNWSLKLYADRLSKKGFIVHNIHYPCRRLNICDSAEYLLPRFKSIASESKVIHLAGHSMGGLVCRRLLYLHKPSTLGRLITMGSPHCGSPVADYLKNWGVFKYLFGPVWQDLLTGKNINWLAPWPPPCETGLIAGRIPIGPGMFLLRNQKSDGTVPHYSSMPAGGCDYAELAASHISIPLIQACADISANFFYRGKFYSET